MRNYAFTRLICSSVEYACTIGNLHLLRFKVMAKIKSFHTCRSKVKVMSKFWYPWRGFITRNAHVKYKIPSSIGSNVMAKVTIKVTRSLSLVSVESVLLGEYAHKSLTVKKVRPR